MGADKRKRSGDAAKKSSSKRQKTASGAGKKVVSVNQLKWKKVEVPDMLDDFEGFYGLEEIEGVDIVREGNVVKFVAPEDKTQVEEGDDGEEFEGFGDEPQVAPASEKSSKTEKKASKGEKRISDDEKDATIDHKKAPKDQKKAPKNTDKAAKDQKKATPDQRKAQKAQADPELEANLFTKLDELEDLPEADVEDVDVTQWESLNLSPQMMAAIANLKFLKPSAIQKRAIPEIMKGHDVIGKASTGSGKTLAFGIPIVESWLERNAGSKSEAKKSPIALILSPTRELAHQISDHLKKLCDGLPKGPYICSVTGGLAIQKQQRQLEKADIIVGTPGRMWEVMSAGTSTLDSIKGISFLVVDEADRLLKDGQFKEAEEILKALDRTVTTENYDDDTEEEESDMDEDAKPTPKKDRQTLVFSATFNRALQQKLAGKARYNLLGAAESLEQLLKKLNFREQPRFIDTNPVSQMAENLKEGLIHCGDLEKDLYLYAVLLLQPMRRALVFTNSINTVRRLTPFLQNLNLPAFALHSDMEQKARLRSLERFRAPGTTSGASPILVATDVAARGLDIPNVDLVIHYHVPRTADDYVHRSGRTARADQSGVSVLLCGPKEDIPTNRLIAKVHASAAAAQSDKPRKALLGVQTIDIDRRLVSTLRPRVDLSKKITETTIAKERGSKDENWLKNAAEELGVEYDSEELEKAGTWKGRGSGRKMKEKEAKEVTKAEMKQWRWELKELLSRRVNTGVSEKYLSGVDVDALLKGIKGEFLGNVDGLGL